MIDLKKPIRRKGTKSVPGQPVTVTKAGRVYRVRFNADLTIEIDRKKLTREFENYPP